MEELNELKEFLATIPSELQKLELEAKQVRSRLQFVFCFLEKMSDVRKLTTFYLAKDDHRWVTFISLKTINSDH